MRLLYIHQYFNLPSMPGSTRSFEFGRRLALKGHQVTVLTSDRAASASDDVRCTQHDGLSVQWIPVRYSNEMTYRERAWAFLSFALRSTILALGTSPDLVLASSTPLTVAIPGIIASARFRIPLVFEVRDLWPEVPIALGALRSPMAILFARLLAHAAYRWARRIVALSPDMRDGICAHGVPEHRVDVIPNAADIARFAVPSARGEELRRAHGWLGERRMLLYAGALGTVNGVGYLVDLARLIATIDPSVAFVIIGSGIEEPRIRDLAARVGLLGKTVFFLPPVPKSRIVDWFSASTLACSLVIDQPALWANSANKVFDTLAAGRPVVLNHQGWLARLVSCNDCGLVLSPTPSPQDARLLVDRLQDPLWLHAAGSRATQLALSDFSCDALADKLAGVLTSALAGKAHGDGAPR